MTRRAYIESVSDFCLPNLFDEERIRGYLAKNGFAIVERCEEADLVVVNTCAFVEERQAASLARVHELESRKRPGARLVVTGCLPEIDPESLGPSFDGVAMGARDLDRLDSVIGAEAPFEEAAETHLLPTKSRPLAGWRIRLRWTVRSAVLGLGKIVRVEPLASILECNTYSGWFYVRKTRLAPPARS